MKTKDFPLATVLGLTTGTVLVDGGYPDIVNVAVWMVGHSLWDTTICRPEVRSPIIEEIFRQHPRLRDVPPVDIVAHFDTPPEIRERIFRYLAHWTSELGATVTLVPIAEDA